MLFEKIKEWLLIIIPSEAIFCVTYIETFEVQFSEQPLVDRCSARTKNTTGSVAIFTTALDEAIPAEQCKPGFLRIGS